MTHDEITALDADGLRLEVARVKGWTFWDSLDHLGPWVRHGDPMEAYYAGGIPLNKCETPDANKITWDDENDPDWPRDIAAAWELVEEIPEPWCITIDRDKSGWLCSIYDIRPYHDTEYHALANTPPLAICRAWLMWKQT